MKREKRAEKGLESLKKQIKIHRKKQESAMDSGNDELFDYYKKEIEKFEGEIRKKRKILEK